MKVLRTIREVRQARAGWRPDAIVGLVPTMGAFHEGHIALFRTARQRCDSVIASLFVNPTQFSDVADLESYPRDEGRDTRIAQDAGVDHLFIPAREEMYSPRHATWVEVEGAATGLEGDFRPGHFRGVATVCLKLFLIVRPRLAFFGQKDAQQVAVVTQMVRDLNVDVDVQIVPTVRDLDGLALSSRNVRLSAEERRRALAIPRALETALAAHREGRDPVAAARAALVHVDTDYVAVADLGGHPTLTIAARVGHTRLIDNVRLDERDVVIMPSQECSHGK